MAESSLVEGKAARTRRRLQQCALDVISETGEFTGELVAERAGVSTPTFYAHFATKDHAIEACLALCFERYEARMRTAQSIELLLGVGLEQTLSRMVAAMVSVNREYAALLRLGRSRIRSSRRLRDQSRRQEREAFAATERFIRLAQAAGQVRKDDPTTLTATVRTVIQGLDTWIVRSHPAVAAQEIPQLLTRYLEPEPTRR